MNCQEFWDRMPELSEKLLADEAAHLAACPACTEAWRQQASLAAGMRRVRAEWRQVEAHPRVEAGLVAAFRSQALSRGRAVPARTLWIPLFAGVAAAVLLALGLLLVRDRPPEPARQSRPGAVELAAVPSTMETSFDENAPDSDGFIPLPNAERIAPDESVNVIRLEVPRSAMLAVGLPVSADQVSELVEADVKMGPDGLARAVRFLNE